MSATVVYIMGAGHSGSTLLSMLLGNHPTCVTFGELSAFDHAVCQNLPCTCGQLILSCPFWRSVLVSYGINNYDFQSLPTIWPTDDRRHAYQSTWARTRYLAVAGGVTWSPLLWSASLIRLISPDAWQRATNTWRLYDILCQVADRPLLVDASKSMIRMKLLYAQRSQHIKVLYLTRDVRAVSASHTKRVKARVTPPALKAKEWRRANHYALASLQALPKNTYMHVCYEARCRHPAVTLQEICDFLGIPYEDKLFQVDHHLFHIIGGNPMRFGGIQSIREDTAWRSRLSPAELTDIEHIAGPLNRKLLGDLYVP